MAAVAARPDAGRSIVGPLAPTACRFDRLRVSLDDAHDAIPYLGLYPRALRIEKPRLARIES